MKSYEEVVHEENVIWRKKMLKRPSVVSKLSKGVQNKINSWIPEKVHQAITVAIKKMIQAVLFGSKYTTQKPIQGASLFVREEIIRKKIENYKKTAAVEGGITGAGGILLGLADFPILIGIKLKLLFDIAAVYGFDVKDYRERLYILHIFELSFSSDSHRRQVFLKMQDWDRKTAQLPEKVDDFEWRKFQQEYRDYLDIAKLAQLVPVIGAPVGLIVNYRLLKKLGKYAMQAYRMRLLKK